MDVNKEGSTTPLINNLEMTEVFKDKDEKKGQQPSITLSISITRIGEA